VAGTEGPAPPPAQPSAPAAAPLAWSVSLGTGGGGYVEFVDAFAGGGPAGYSGSTRQGRVQLNGRVERELTRRSVVGLAWTYNRWTETYFSGATRVGAIENSVQVLMAGLRSRWLQTDQLELYSGVAAGLGRWRQAGEGIAAGQTGVQSGFAFQLRGLGISAGNERFRAFAELGLGFEGLLIAGLTLRL
jgi:hypothetical protein